MDNNILKMKMDRFKLLEEKRMKNTYFPKRFQHVLIKTDSVKIVELNIIKDFTKKDI